MVWCGAWYGMTLELRSYLNLYCIFACWPIFLQVCCIKSSVTRSVLTAKLYNYGKEYRKIEFTLICMKTRYQLAVSD